ncbi:MAG: lipoyl synthase [bacterium]
MPRIPPWIRLRMSAEGKFANVHELVGDLGLHTVCKSAKCPNIHECWGRGTATLMLLGSVCTRACTFCAIPTGRPRELDIDEPRRVAAAAKRMNLRHVVLTSVCRDDLPDGGAGIFAETIRAIREVLPESTIEVLTPDFQGVEDSLRTVLEARPDVFNHNIETVSRLQSVIRPQASYGRSLSVLKFAAAWQPALACHDGLGPSGGLAVKSGVMLGLGETDDEVVFALKDLHQAGCRFLTIGQYLQPSRKHCAVERFVSPGEFARFEGIAREIGFEGIASGPMVRSSYKADELLELTRA